MPIITVTLIKGYDETVRTDLSQRLTNAAMAATGALADGVSVVLNEVPASNYMRGGRHRQSGTPPPSASDCVRSYLSAMEARDLDTARSFLDDEFTMIFPGNCAFRSLEDLVKWAASRYLSIGKTYERFDEVPDSDGNIVYCMGTLHGKWLDGTPFSDIRFIDRFVVVQDKLTHQQVWNDLAENSPSEL